MMCIGGLKKQNDAANERSMMRLEKKVNLPDAFMAFDVLTRHPCLHELLHDSLFVAD